MPAIQQGEVKKTAGGKWSIRYYDPNDLYVDTKTGKLKARRKQRGGFNTKSEAQKALRDLLDELRLGPRQRVLTVQEVVDEFLAQHICEPTTMQTLTSYLKHVTGAFGDVRVDRLQVNEIRAWRKRLPEKVAYEALKRFRQVLNYAVDCEYVTLNKATRMKNPKPKSGEVLTFGSWDEIEAVAVELGTPLPIIVAGTGLRTQEWIALERGDIDRSGKVPLLHVRRTCIEGRVKDYGKTEDSIRPVPLQRRVLDALEALPARLDTKLLFPGTRGGFLSLAHWRRNAWNPAVEAAGLPHMTPYSLRHFYAAFNLQAGVSAYAVAERMGTSLEMISKTYGHLLPSAAEHDLALVEKFDAESYGHLSDTGSGQ
jgi:integrase